MQIESTKLLLASGLRDLILYRLSRYAQTENSWCYVDTYQNGRECGYTVHVNDKKTCRSVTISECRNSDSIMIYMGNHATQGLSEEAYKNSASFKYEDYTGAVNFCVNYFID